MSSPPARVTWTATAATSYFGDYETVTVTAEPLGPGALVPDGTAHIGLASRRLHVIEDRAVVKEWEVTAYALTAEEAMERLYEAEPLLPERIARLSAEGRHVQRWYRLAGGQLLDPCAHPDAVPVDTLWTRERVAYLCPECDAELPADRGRAAG